MRLITDDAQKHILLLKLLELYHNAPNLPGQVANPRSEDREWLASVGAALNAVGIRQGPEHIVHRRMLAEHPEYASSQILGSIRDAIEELALDLELGGRSEMGAAYAPGEVYKFYTDLRAVFSSASRQVLVVDPYFNGDAFGSYFQDPPSFQELKILSERYVESIRTYAKKFAEEYHLSVEVRKSDQLDDRLVIIDKKDCWIVGQSIKDAATKPTYLIPLGPSIATKKIGLYERIWMTANNVGAYQAE